MKGEAFAAIAGETECEKGEVDLALPLAFGIAFEASADDLAIELTEGCPAAISSAIGSATEAARKCYSPLPSFADVDGVAATNGSSSVELAAEEASSSGLFGSPFCPGTCRASAGLADGGNCTLCALTAAAAASAFFAFRLAFFAAPAAAADSDGDLGTEPDAAPAPPLLLLVDPLCAEMVRASALPPADELLAPVVETGALRIPRPGCGRIWPFDGSWSESTALDLPLSLVDTEVTSSSTTTSLTRILSFVRAVAGTNPGRWDTFFDEVEAVAGCFPRQVAA